jgi:GNAT superfamily N-acetyltransferase
MKQNLSFEILTEKNIPEIAILGKQANEKLTIAQIENYSKEMFLFPNYLCFGAFINGKLVGISSGWITVRFYCGKQLEVDNVIVDHRYQSKGIGKHFFEYIDNWAKSNDFQTIELNAYTHNAKAHKFYFNLDYKIIGFHFQKNI